MIGAESAVQHSAPAEDDITSEGKRASERFNWRCSERFDTPGLAILHSPHRIVVRIQ